jgi:hypothetical protein
VKLAAIDHNENTLALGPFCPKLTKQSLLACMHCSLQDEQSNVETRYPGGTTIPGNLPFEGSGAALMLRDNQDGRLVTTSDMLQ